MAVEKYSRIYFIVQGGFLKMSYLGQNTVVLGYFFGPKPDLRDSVRVVFEEVELWRVNEISLLGQNRIIDPNQPNW